MKEEDLKELIQDGESDRLELKSSLAEMDKVARTVCAFSNDLPGHGEPGVVVVGVENDGSCADFSITDEVLTSLANLRSDGRIVPLPLIAVEKTTLEDCQVATVKVEPSPSPPVRFRGRVYVRVGPSTRRATPDEERRLTEKRRASDLPFDLRPLPSASLADLDFDVFDEYLEATLPIDLLEANSRHRVEQLASLRFTTAEKPEVPTVLGVLVAGQEPRRFVPGDYVQFLRLAGTDLSVPIKDQKEIDGPLPELLRQLNELLKVNISTALDVTEGDRDLRKPNYPLVALQQLTRNAILHRNYEGTHAPVRLSWFSDRIEIQNPGGPYGQVTKENFGQPGITDYRNPHLAEAMKNLGYVQRFGFGIEMARNALKANGNPALEYDIQDTHVLVTIRPSTSSRV